MLVMGVLGMIVIAKTVTACWLQHEWLEEEEEETLVCPTSLWSRRIKLK